jgi:arylsulfatase A-like enzyme
MASADRQLGRLVAQLQARGEWENTLLIVTADHGDWPGLGWFDADPRARVPYLNPYLTRVPLVVTWPARIPPGRRFRDPVSLVDLLPTMLDLTEQPHPDHLQGQSLAPLLLGRSGWRPRPVILDEINVDPKTGEISGAYEIVDGRWGASLAIAPGGAKVEDGPRLLLYDLWNDPYCLRNLHRERPDLVKKYTGLLERRFREHRALAKKLKPRAGGALDPRQLETLKSLGYIG